MNIDIELLVEVVKHSELSDKEILFLIVNIQNLGDKFYEKFGKQISLTI